MSGCGTGIVSTTCTATRALRRKWRSGKKSSQPCPAGDPQCQYDGWPGVVSLWRTFVREESATRMERLITANQEVREHFTSKSGCEEKAHA